VKFPYIIILFSFISFQSTANDTVTHYIEKVFGMGFIFESFVQMECGSFLKTEESESFQKISQSLEEMKIEVAKKYSKELNKVIAPNSKTRQQADKWLKNRFQRIKKNSHNISFSCGVLYGSIVSESSRFERSKISLIMALKAE